MSSFWVWIFLFSIFFTKHRCFSVLFILNCLGNLLLSFKSCHISTQLSLYSLSILHIFQSSIFTSQLIISFFCYIFRSLTYFNNFLLEVLVLHEHFRCKHNMNDLASIWICKCTWLELPLKILRVLLNPFRNLFFLIKICFLSVLSISLRVLLFLILLFWLERGYRLNRFLKRVLIWFWKLIVSCLFLLLGVTLKSNFLFFLDDFVLLSIWILNLVFQMLLKIFVHILI